MRSSSFPSINTKTDNNVLKTVDNLGNTAIASLNDNVLRIIVFDNKNTVKWQNQTTLTSPYVHKLNSLTFFDEQNIYPLQYKQLINELNKLDNSELDLIIELVKLITKDK